MPRAPCRVLLLSNWDAGLASSLLKDYRVRAGKAVKGLSRGQRSALRITIGLAACAEVTLFDEPYAGLDAVARQVFYDRLLAEYADFPARCCCLLT